MKTMISLSLALCLFTCCCRAQQVDNSTVSSLDLDRYLGEWYEIARFDHPFERGMHHTKAFYELRDDGKVAVYNSGWKEGKAKISKGKAKLTDNPALLRVSFFGPFYSDYRVMHLDDNYQYVLVGSKSDKYLWILSRSPQLDELTKIKLVNEAGRRGYDVEELIWVDHK